MNGGDNHMKGKEGACRNGKKKLYHQALQGVTIHLKILFDLEYHQGYEWIMFEQCYGNDNFHKGICNMSTTMSLQRMQNL